MISLIACLISYSMFSFTLNYIFALYLYQLNIYNTQTYLRQGVWKPNILIRSVTTPAPLLLQWPSLVSKPRLYQLSTGFPGCPIWEPPPQNVVIPPPPKKKVQAFNCLRVFFSPNFNKSSPNILSLQETLIKTIYKVSRNSTQGWYSISIIIIKKFPIMITQ